MSPRRERNADVRRGRTVVHSLHVHLVFTPKYRRGPFTSQILRRCEEIMRDVCADFGAELREFNGEAGPGRDLLTRSGPGAPLIQAAQLWFAVSPARAVG